MNNTEPSGRAGFWSLSTLLQVVAATGLAVDARVHWKLAPAYDAVKTSTISQGTLFRVEAVLAVAAALIILLSRHRLAALTVVMVAGGGLVPLFVYRYYNLGTLGPLPPMYEPLWYADKTNTAIAQGVATAAALMLILLAAKRKRRPGS